MSNEIISLNPVNNSVAIALASDMFRDIDFTGIATAIENIADSNHVFSPEEKHAAASLVDQWERDVISRMSDRRDELAAFVNFFNVSTEGRIAFSSSFKEMGADLAATTNTVAEYNALLALIEDLSDIDYNKPEKPISEFDIDKTQKEIMEEQSDYRLAYAKYELARKKKIREIYIAERDWKRNLQKNKEVVELIQKSNAYSRNFHKLTNICRDKSQVAKLNIAIQNKDLRDSLKSLLDFSSTEI